MSVKSLEIFFIRTPNVFKEMGFLPGRSVTGTIAITCKAPLLIRSLKVKFKGKATVKWVEDDDNSSSTTYSDKEKYFEADIQLLGETTIGPGKQEIPFSYELPQQIPSSYKGRNGCIEYTITAILKEKQSFLWSGVHKKVGVFPVYRMIDLNNHTLAKMPIVRRKAIHDFFNLSGNQGNVELIASIPCSGFVKGETFVVEVKVINSSPVFIRKCFLILAEKLVLHAEGRQIIVSNELSRVKFDGMAANTTRNYLLSMVIPKPNHGDISTCSIIKQTYYMQIELVPVGFHRNPTLVLDPLFYGNIPFTNIIEEAKPVLRIQPISTRNSLHSTEAVTTEQDYCISNQLNKLYESQSSNPTSNLTQNQFSNQTFSRQLNSPHSFHPSFNQSNNSPSTQISHLINSQGSSYLYDPPPPYTPAHSASKYSLNEIKLVSKPK